MKKRDGVHWVIIAVLVLTNVFFATRVIQLTGELHEAQAAAEVQRVNAQVAEFVSLFVTKVLKADEEVTFETRLQLENAVRALGDEEILTAWTRLIESDDEAQAQEEVITLLGVLMNKLRF